jgi:hypothetical protein
MLGRSRQRRRVLVTHACCCERNQGRLRHAGARRDRSKCRPTASRNTEASAGVNPALPSRVGNDAIRSQPRPGHTSLKTNLVGCRRRSRGPGSAPHRPHAMRAYDLAEAAQRASDDRTRREIERSKRAFERAEESTRGSVRRESGVRANPVPSKQRGHAHREGLGPRCASRAGHDERRQGSQSSFARAEAVLGGEVTKNASGDARASDAGERSGHGAGSNARARAGEAPERDHLAATKRRQR